MGGPDDVTIAVLEVDSTEAKEGVRIDLWAWSVRLFKSRTLAAAACKKGQFLVNGQRCRPSRLVRVGDRLEVKQGLLRRRLEVRELLRQRVAAREVPRFVIDHTPPEEAARAAEEEMSARRAVPQRESGSGRPTKRERRDLEDWAAEEAEEGPTFEKFVRVFLGRLPSR